MQLSTLRPGRWLRHLGAMSAALACATLVAAALPPPALAAGAAPAKAAQAAKAVNAVKAAPPQDYAIVPVPAWVERLVPEATVPAGLPAAPVQVLLRDHQTRLTGAGASATVQRYVHSVRQVRESAGLESGSQIEIEFDPATQKLQWHTLAVWRGSQRIDKLDPAKIKLLHREQQLERQMIDGRLTASVVLDDVRVGDRVELAYTLVGDNPVFGGRFVEQDWSVSSLGPVAWYRYRLLAPATRAIRDQLGDAGLERSERRMGADREVLYTRRLAPQFRWDANAPGIVYARDLVQLSEFADWADVGAWAQQLFLTAGAAAGPGVAQRAAAIRAASADPAERARRALDLVQTEVRYFGTEIGPYTHQPAPVEQVLTQRFGDCKDKAALLVALLAALDIRATPVLVSQRFQADVRRLLPSPLAFDHAIAAVELDGRTLWLDGTRSQQTGPVAERQGQALGVALPARVGAQLQDMGSTTGMLRSSTEDVYTVDSFSGDLALESSLTLYGEAAEGVRATRATMPADEFERGMATDYLRMYPGARVEGALQVQDLPDHNALRLVQRFRIADAWRFPQQRQLTHELAFQSLMSVLRLPDQNPRQLALRLALPGVYRHAAEYRFAEPVFARPGSQRHDERSSWYELALTQENTVDRQRIQAELRMLADRVEAADWTRYRDQLIKTWPRLSGSLSVAVLNTAQLEQLRSKFSMLDEDVRRGRIRIVTEAQREARVRLLVLGDQLASPRLGAPRLRAEALLARGVQLDHLARAEEARADLEQALALDPGNVEIRPALAVNALLRGDDDKAVAHAEAALALSPSDVAPRYTRAYARYMQGRFDAAADELTAILASRGEVERSYGPIWLHLAAKRAGRDAAQALAPFLPQASEPAWPHPVLRHLRGEIDFPAVLAAANDRASGKPDPGRLCELYFFLGQKALAAGDAQRARGWFQRAVDTGVTEFNEYALAQRELQRLR